MNPSLHPMCRKILRDCIQTLRHHGIRGYNAANVVVPALVAMIDGMLSNFASARGIKSWQTRRSGGFQKLRQEIESVAYAYGEPAVDLIFDMLFAAAYYGQIPASARRFNRHWITHGNWLQYGRVEHVLRLFLMVRFLQHLRIQSAKNDGLDRAGDGRIEVLESLKRKSVCADTGAHARAVCAGVSRACVWMRIAVAGQQHLATLSAPRPEEYLAARSQTRTGSRPMLREPRGKAAEPNGPACRSNRWPEASPVAAGLLGVTRKRDSQPLVFISRPLAAQVGLFSKYHILALKPTLPKGSPIGRTRVCATRYRGRQARS